MEPLSTIPNIAPRTLLFDMDGTLTPSKSTLQPAMSEVLSKLLEAGRVIMVTSGGSLTQFEEQFLPYLNLSEDARKRLYLAPTSGAQLLHYEDGKWNIVYENALSEEEKEHIRAAVMKALDETSVELSQEVYGERLEDRHTQMSLSMLGQDAPYEKKKVWDPNLEKRKDIASHLIPLLPGFAVRIGGTTTIDITKEGIDKEYGVNAFFEFTGLAKDDALFIGDAVFEGGNDYAVLRTGIPVIDVDGPEEALAILTEMVKNL